MVLDPGGKHASRWAAVMSIATKIGCTPQTFNEWGKRTEDNGGAIRPDACSAMTPARFAVQR